MMEVSALRKVIEDSKELLARGVLFNPLELTGEVARSKKGPAKAQTDSYSTKTICSHFAQL